MGQLGLKTWSFLSIGLLELKRLSRYILITMALYTLYPFDDIVIASTVEAFLMAHLCCNLPFF